MRLLTMRVWPTLIQRSALFARVSKGGAIPLVPMPYRFFSFGGLPFGSAGRFGCNAGRFGNPP